MKSLYVEKNEEIVDVLNKLAADDEVKSVLLFFGGENSPSKEFLDPILQSFEKPIIGGIFPELLFQNKRKNSGAMFLPLSKHLDTCILNLDDSIESCMTVIQKKASQKIVSSDKRSMFIFLDAFSKNKSSFIYNIYNFFGLTVNYIGAGAGTLSFESKPNIIHNTGLHQNAVVIGNFIQDMSVAVAHGWNPIDKPLKVTSAEGNIIKTLDWEPAVDVYKRVVENNSNVSFNENNFFDIVKSYPIGMVKLDSEMVVRDTFNIKGSDIYILDEVAEGEYVSVMHGDMDTLLNGAKKVKSQLEQKNASPKEDNYFCVDCISRVLFMGEDFKEEVEILRGDNDLDGVLSLGEIANEGDTFLEIYNKSVVLAQWKEKN